MMMAKKKTTEVAGMVPTQAFHPEPGGIPPPEQPERQDAALQPTASQNGEHTATDRRPLRVLSYQVNHDVYVQASIWDRQAQRRDGASFTAYDVSVRKRWKDPVTGEWRSAYSFSASELYAVVHALQAAAAVILELRAAEVPF
jgi:hypothetical protein